MTATPQRRTGGLPRRYPEGRTPVAIHSTTRIAIDTRTGGAMQVLLRRAAAQHGSVTTVDEEAYRRHMAQARTREDRTRIQRIDHSTLEVEDHEGCQFTADRHGMAESQWWRDDLICHGAALVVRAKSIRVIAQPAATSLPPLRLPLDTAVCVPDTATPGRTGRVLPNLALVTTRRTRSAAVADIAAMVHDFLQLTAAGGLDTADASRAFAAAALALHRGGQAEPAHRERPEGAEGPAAPAKQGGPR